MKFSPKPHTMNPIPKHLCLLLMLFLANLAFSQTAYVITGSGTEFTATKGEETVENGIGEIQAVIDAIKSDADGEDVSIQFGDGTDELDIETANISFDGGTAGADWGKITILGKITSQNISSNGVIYMSNGVSVESTADITGANYAIRNGSTGILAIGGGTISATSGSAVSNASTGAVNISGGTVSAISGTAVNNSSTGKISVSGTAVITSANTNTSSGTIFIASSGTATAVRLEITGGEINNTSGRTIYNASTGAITISGGTISATSYTIYNASTGVITISGGTISATSYTIYNFGTVNIIDGTISANSRAVYNNYGYVNISGGIVSAIGSNGSSTIDNSGILTISGGTVLATGSNDGRAIYNYGTVTVSGGTISSTGSSGYAVYNSSSYGSSTITINITGGIISGNTAIYSSLINTSYNVIITISGGTILATGTNGYSIYIFGSSNISIILDDSPNIEGKIFTELGSLSVTNNFAPNDYEYMLEFNSYSNDMVAVANGAKHLSNFTLKSDINAELSLVESGEDLVLKITNGYSVSKNEATYVIALDTGNIATAHQAIDYIKSQAGSKDVSIQFGDGENELDMGTDYINFTGTDWGKITLLGKIASSNGTIYGIYGTIYMGNNVSLESKADIKNTNGNAIYNVSTGVLTISGGTISSANSNSNAVYNGSTGTSIGTVNIIGGTINGTVYNGSSNGTINISGGIINGTVSNSSSNGTINISDGIVNGTVFNNSNGGIVNISGGTISVTGDRSHAVNNNNGTVNISGGTISSVNYYSVYGVSDITLGGSPSIEGEMIIMPGNLSVITSGENAFDPNDKTYTITFTAFYYYSNGIVVVKNGADFISNFVLSNIDYGLVISEDDIVVTDKVGYIYTSNGTSFTISKIIGVTTSIQSVIDSIKAEANGSDVSIQFGDGINELNISSGSITFDGGELGTDWGKITLLGKITSSNTSYTILITNGISVNSKADIRNTYDRGIAIYNRSMLTISNGTISSAYTAVYNLETLTITGGIINGTISNGYVGYIILGGSPSIEGIIEATAGTLSVITSGENTFVPANEQYTLKLNSTVGVAVANGASYISNFRLASDSELFVSGSDIVLALEEGYSVSLNEDVYAINYSTGTFATIQDAINSIQMRTNGADVSIQFGNGTDELDIGTEYVSLYDATGWGKIMLLGKITSSSTSGTIYMSNDVSLESKADIKNTTNNAINNYGGTINISGGTVSSISNYAIYNFGTVTISGGIVYSTSNYAVYNRSSGTINISGGTISSTNNYVVYNFETGTINISGGTISAMSNYTAVYNSETGTINISGGTISATGDYSNAISNNYNGTVNIIGGTISATGDYSYAINNLYKTSYIFLGGNLNIEGGIRIETGTLSVITEGDNAFIPNDKIYTIELPFYSDDVLDEVVVVKNGAAFISNFVLVNNTLRLIASGNDIILADKMAGEIVAAPDLDSKTGTSITIKPVVASNEQEVEYTISRYVYSYDYQYYIWQTDLTFTDLNEDTDYYIFARTKENDNYKIGDVSQPLEVRTDYTSPIISTANPPVANIAVQAINGGISLKNLPSNAKVELYNLQGKLVYSGNSGNSQILKILIQTKGMYIVKAGTQKFKVSFTH